MLKRVAKHSSVHDKSFFNNTLLCKGIRAVSSPMLLFLALHCCFLSAGKHNSKKFPSCPEYCRSTSSATKPSCWRALFVGEIFGYRHQPSSLPANKAMQCTASRALVTNSWQRVSGVPIDVLTTSNCKYTINPQMKGNNDIHMHVHVHVHATIVISLTLLIPAVPPLAPLPPWSWSTWCPAAEGRSWVATAQHWWGWWHSLWTFGRWASSRCSSEQWWPHQWAERGHRGPQSWEWAAMRNKRE